MRNGPYLVITLLLAIFLGGCTGTSSDPANQKNAAVQIFDQTCLGVLESDNTFLCADASPSFSLTGTWKDHVPDGAAIITYEDGRTLETTFDDGVIHGQVRETFPDGTCRIFQCIGGIPAGVSCTYSQDGELTGVDHYYHSYLIEQLKARATEHDYRDYTDGTLSSGIPIKITGTVAAIYDDAKSEYLILTDHDSHFYILRHYNHEINTWNQGIVPNLSIGEEVDAYGFFQTIDSLKPDAGFGVPVISLGDEMDDADADVAEVLEEIQEEVDQEVAEDQPGENAVADADISGRTSVFPHVVLFYAERTQEKDETHLHPSVVSYAQLQKDPYRYYGLPCELQGEVLTSYIDSSSSTIEFKLRQGDGEVFYVHYPYEKGDALPLVGDTISVTGEYAGNDKTKSGRQDKEEGLLEYLIIPCIYAESIAF